MRDLTLNEKWLIIRKRISACVFYLCIVAYVLVGYYTKEWRWSLFIFLAVPVVPVLLGLKGLNVSYEVLILIVYLSIGFSTGQWHPWWVLFITIPVYHILFSSFTFSKIKINVKEYVSKDKEKIFVKNESNKRDYINEASDDYFDYK